MLFTNKNRPESISINVRDHTIKEVTETKFLGVIIDNKLCWKAHINYISKKISKSISLLKMLKYTFPSRILKSMYYSFVTHTSIIVTSFGVVLPKLTLNHSYCFKKNVLGSLTKLAIMTLLNHFL